MTIPAQTARTGGGAGSGRGALDRWFGLTARGSTWAREVRGGLVTFVTMAYIVVLNPLIIGTAPDATGARLGTVAVAGATALAAGGLSVLMGSVGRYPFAIAAGLGLNAFVAYTLAPQMTWPQAMGLVVLEGVAITVLVLSGLRRVVMDAVPRELKTAIGAGIGLFIALVGFVDGGFVRAGSGTPVQLGSGGSLVGWPSVVFVVGLLVTLVLVARGVPAAILLGILVATALALVVQAVAHPGAVSAQHPGGWQLTVPRLPDRVVALPDLSIVGHVDVLGAADRVGVVAVVLFVFTLLLSDFFDSIGTVTAVAQEAGLTDERGAVPGVQAVLVVDSLAALGGGLTSSSSNTIFVESASGVGEGARTGIAAIVTGGLFLLALFLTPLVDLVPAEAATPALVVVGLLMFRQVRLLDLGDVVTAVPAFLTIVVMPFTYSISNGIGAGFVSYAVLRLLTGRAREVHPVVWVVAVAFAVYFAITPLEQVAGVA